MEANKSTHTRRVAAFSGADGYGDRASVDALVKTALKALALPEGYIRPGDRVVLKPNWVKEHDERNPGSQNWEHVVTHPSVIESVARWVAPFLQGSGSITVCDAPQTDSSFGLIRSYCQLDAMIARLRQEFDGVRFELLDLRPEEWHAVDGVTVSKRSLPGDPLGSTLVCLNDASEFVGFSGLGRLYGASFDMAETNTRHEGLHHEYMLCRTPMEADVFINLPKLKTHKKVGITCALKNLVGINANKNWLPHHTEGTPEAGGDQFPVATVKSRLEHSWMGVAKRWLKHRPSLSRVFVPVKKLARLYFGDTQSVVRSGNWHGNDTCWRMVLDLNKCLFSFGGDGLPRTTPVRYLAVVDGIVGGEGNGPMSPDPVASGIIIAGVDPASVDCVAAEVMGFDWRKVRLLKGAFEIQHLNFARFPPDEIRVISNNPSWDGPLGKMSNTFHFKPHFGWTGAIEKQTRSFVA